MDIMRMGQAPGYLGSWDLDDLPNREVTLVIDSIKDESVVTNGQKETCTVIHWTDKNYKPMIINITNKKNGKLFNKKDLEFIEALANQGVPCLHQRDFNR